MRNHLLDDLVRLGAALAVLCSCTLEPSWSEHSTVTGFSHVIVDEHGPLDAWGKAVGDIDGDGRLDLVVGGHSSQELVWYRNPEWKKGTIATGKRFGTDHEVVDVDKDGRNDIATITDTQLLWYRNPDWSPTIIDTVSLHDIEVADFDGDGDLDVVGRDQSAFDGSGATLFFYAQETPSRWTRSTIQAPEGEGLRVADIDGDGQLDVVVNGVWLRNPGELRAGEWIAHAFADHWKWPHVYIDIGDINGDDRADIVLAPAEPEGSRYRLSWFENPPDPSETWAEHVIDADIETVHHFVGVGDMNNDARADVVTAEMHQSVDPDEIKIYFSRDRNGNVWEKRMLGTAGSHTMRLVDVDADGDVDLFGANWSGEHQPVELWINQTCAASAPPWRRHVVDDDMPWRAIFVAAADIDGDGHRDIIAGGWWYRNTGNESDRWKRNIIGAKARNMAAVYDFDRDDRQDVLATQGRDAEPNANLVWARNVGSGRFEVIEVGQARGDFLQGVAVAHFAPGKRLAAALSWHQENQGVQALIVPDDPSADTWRWQRISSISQDEALSAGDIDRDGDADLLLGTRWLRNEGDRWTDLTLFETANKSDRNRLADMNGDGRLDAIVGYEAISEAGVVAWYEQGEDSSKLWREHIIARVTGPMSLDVTDMDNDGDLDVVVGEHNLDDPGAARLLVFANVDGSGRKWRQQVVHTGDEHHDGAQAADIDADGDMDIVSIGWSHQRVLLYENLSNNCAVEPHSSPPGRTTQ